MEIENIKGLDKTRFYWIQLKGADLTEMKRVESYLDPTGLSYLITNDKIDFKQAPEGMILEKTKNGFIIKPSQINQ